MGWGSLMMALVAAVLVAAEPAEAAPPTLVSVGHARGYPSLSWTLPPGVEPQTVEAATQSLVARDGFLLPKPREVKVVRLGRGMGVWRLGMQYRTRPGLRRVIRRPRHFGPGCIAGAVLASRIDYYAGVRVSWRFWRDQRGQLRSILVEVASARPGDRSDDGFVIGESALANVRGRYPKGFHRHVRTPYRLGPTLVSRFRKTGYESGEYVDYWFNARGRLVALAAGISGC
jgi:hypothetical protein